MNQESKKGFTLVELMLAMTFISGLLLAIAMTVIQISNIYTRGLTLKEVNQAGRSLSADLRDSIATSTSFPVNYPTAGSRYIKQPWGGRLCVGQYSYVWNYGTTLADGSANGSNSNVYDGSSSKKIRFVKVPDSTGNYCSDALGTGRLINAAEAVELLDVGDRELAVHGFTISTEGTASDSRTKQSLYAISFVIGTNEQSALSANQSGCIPPSSDNVTSDINYCSVNQFDITARSGNAVQ